MNAAGTPSAGSAPGAAPPNRGLRSSKEIYDDTLRELESEIPGLDGVAARQTLDYGDTLVRFRLDEEHERIVITATVGKPEPARELEILDKILQLQLSSSTPAYWMPGWDRESGQIVIVSHFFLVDDMPNRLIGLTVQVEVCVQMALSMQRTQLGKGDAAAKSAGATANAEVGNQPMAAAAGHKKAGDAATSDKPAAPPKPLSTSVALSLALRRQKPH